MNLNFVFNANSVATSVENLNEEACAKLEKAMLNGAELIIRAFTSKQDYPIFKLNVVYPNRTDEFYIPAYEEIVQTVINYLVQGKASEIQFNEEKFEASKTENDFSLELFKEIVGKGIRINTVSAFKGAKYFNAHTKHKKGQMVFKIERTEEFEDYLAENNLI